MSIGGKVSVGTMSQGGIEPHDPWGPFEPGNPGLPINPGYPFDPGLPINPPVIGPVNPGIGFESSELKAVYSWLAYGTKAGVQDGTGGHGFEYLGSLVYERTPEGLRLESAAFGGGRIQVAHGSFGETYTPNYFLTDHLGSTRVVLNGTSDPQRSDYHAFGLRWNESGELAQNRYLYNGKELQEIGGINYLDFGVRMYDSRILRFTGIDPLAEKFSHLSPFNYASNSPISNIDLWGLQAWNINNAWNDDYINQYKQYVSNYTNDGSRYTCEDFALSLLIDFASQNELPVIINNKSGRYSSASEKYSDIGTYKNDVLKTTGAKDLQINANAVGITAEGSTSGDIILNRKANGDAKHVQVIQGIDGDNVNIIQGNTNFLRGRGLSDPANSNYGGMPIENAMYNRATDFYNNLTSGSSYDNFSIVKNIEYRRWNFNNFNNIGVRPDAFMYKPKF